MEVDLQGGERFLSDLKPQSRGDIRAGQRAHAKAKAALASPIYAAYYWTSQIDRLELAQVLSPLLIAHPSCKQRP